MKNIMAATAFALTVATPALSQECQTGFSVDRIDFIEKQAVLILTNPSGDKIEIWTNPENNVDRFGADAVNFEIQNGDTGAYLDTASLQQMLNDLTVKTSQVWGALETSPDGVNRGGIYKMSYRLNTFNNESGRTTIPQFEIEVNRGNGLTEFFNPYEDFSPLDFALDGMDLIMLDKLALSSIDMIDVTNQVIPKHAFTCP